MLEKLYHEFQSPSNTYRAAPFWSWNGKLKKEELLRQIDIMKQMGFGGFFMHSRTGLVTEYLGEEWFELVNACADYAEKIGLEAWLYDEDRWPSGTAGGLVTKNPEYRIKYIRMMIVDSEEFKWNKEYIAAFEGETDGVILKAYKRIEYGQKPCCHDVFVFKIEEMAPSDFYNGYTYLDTMSKEATEKFIELTHEKYKQHCGDRLGRSIKGIFTDEPHRGSVMDGFSLSNPDPKWLTPYTPKLFEGFEAKYGYRLEDKLPELFLLSEDGIISKVKWQYMELLQQLFLDNFAKPYLKWCSENRIEVTGHVLHEDSLTSQSDMQGSLMRYYEYMDKPGIDFLTEPNRNFHVAKQIQSAAHQLGRTKLLTELYGCTGWQMGFENYKHISDWQLLMGVNWRCPHLSWYTMEGEAKRDYPASIFYQSAWWPEYKYYEDYCARISTALSFGKWKHELLVITPIESLWGRIYPGWANGLSAQDKMVRHIEEIYVKVFQWLLGNGLDFSYGDEEMMSRLCSVKTDAEGHAVLKFGMAEYKTILVAGAITLRRSTLEILDSFVKAGGELVFAGDLPEYIDAEKSNEIERVAEKSQTVNFEEKAIINELKKHIKTDISIENENGEVIKDIIFHEREENGCKVIFFLNLNREERYQNVRITLDCAGKIEQWDCLTGEKCIPVFETSEDKTVVSASFEAGGELLLAIDEKEKPVNNPEPEFRKTYIDLPGTFEYRLLEPNVCVLDIAKWRTDKEQWQDNEEVLKIDRKVRKQFSMPYRGGEMVQPWYVNKYNPKQAESVCSLSMQFEFWSDHSFKYVRLAIESPDLWSISLNGKPVTDLTQEYWVDPCFKLFRIGDGMIQEGQNILEISCKFSSSVNIEALYLLGDFGVTLDKSRKMLTKLPDILYAGDITAQGLPFYSGKIEYSMNLSDIKNKNAEIEFGKFGGACITSFINGRERICAWAPYRLDISGFEGNKLPVTLALTRRNTFGPLHQVPALSYAYGPDNFLTEGERFTYDYALVKAGLMQVPRIIQY